ncbi:membrane protein, putativve [Babesia divergens]|uniref:Membrane protein, putativve n=1 Tax=Babesia divergens TaxID=32595 RepID=A0AAD9LKA6_BABDI|nr:membrane protein, putativve [Babesia divergens]
MARTITVVASILGILVAFCSVSSCAKRGYGGALNAMAPHLLNTAASLITGSPYGDPEEPHISLKIVPSKRIHLTPSEMNSLLFTIKQEIHRKDLLEHRAANEKHLSAWALNQAPVYMPFRDNAKDGSKKHEPTLQMAVKHMQEEAEASSKETTHNKTGSVKDLKAQQSTIATA